MGRPASSDYWRHWRAAHPGVPGAGTGASPGETSGRLSLAEEPSSKGRSRADPGRDPSAPDLGAGARRRPRPRGPPRPPLRRALPRRRRRDRPRSTGAPGPGRTSHRLAADGALLAPPRRAAARGRLSGGWLAHGSAPVGAARPTPAPAAGRRRTSAAATAAAARASRTASGARPTIRSGGPAAWRRLAKRTVEDWVARPRLDLPGLASRSRTRCDPASSRPTIRCRSSSVASRCPLSPASSARAATPARG